MSEQRPFAAGSVARLVLFIDSKPILRKAESAHEHTTDSGTMRLCEFDRGKIVRSVQLPETVDPDSAKAEYRNGMLHLTSAIAKAATQKVDIKGA